MPKQQKSSRIKSGLPLLVAVKLRHAEKRRHRALNTSGKQDKPGIGWGKELRKREDKKEHLNFFLNV